MNEHVHSAKLLLEVAKTLLRNNPELSKEVCKVLERYINNA